MYLIKTQRSVLVVAILAAIAAIALSLYYYYSYVSYGQLTLKQIPPKQILTTIPFMEISQETVDHIPKLAQAIREVTIRYDRATQDCPARQLVFCDVPSATRYTTSISNNEYESLRNSNSISFNALNVSNNNNDAFEANVKYRCSHENLADGTFEEYCYYALKIERTPANWFG